MPNEPELRWDSRLSLNKPLSEKDLEQMLKSSDKGTYNSSRSSASPQENRSR